MKLKILMLAAFLSPSFCSADEFNYRAPGVAGGWDPAMFWHTKAVSAPEVQLVNPVPEPVKVVTSDHKVPTLLGDLKDLWMASGRLAAVNKLSEVSFSSVYKAEIKKVLLEASVNDQSLKVRSAARKAAVKLILTVNDVKAVKSELKQYAKDANFQNKVDLAQTLNVLMKVDKLYSDWWSELFDLKNDVLANMKPGEKSLYNARVIGQ